MHVLIHMHSDTISHRRARAHKEPLSNSHTRPCSPPSGPVEGHVFVSRCQDAGVCSFSSRSIRFILFSRGCPFVCGPVSFQPTPISPQEDASVSAVLQEWEWKAQTSPVNATVVCWLTFFQIKLVRAGPRSQCEVVFNKMVLFRSVFHARFYCLLSPAHYFCNTA